MSAKHWMPFYVADYLADTSHLTTNQHGIYLLLMLHYWRRGPLPYDAMHLQCNNIAKAMDEQSKSDVGFVLSEFFTQENDKWCHKRIDAERQEANEKHQKRVDAARKSHKSRRGNSKAGAMQEQSRCNARARQGAEQLQPQPHSHEQLHKQQEGGKEGTPSELYNQIDPTTASFNWSSVKSELSDLYLKCKRASGLDAKWTEATIKAAYIKNPPSPADHDAILEDLRRTLTGYQSGKIDAYMAKPDRYFAEQLWLAESGDGERKKCPDCENGKTGMDGDVVILCRKCEGRGYVSG